MARGVAAKLAQKTGLKHANSDQSTNHAKTTLTRSKSDMPTTSKRIVDIGRSHERSTNELHTTEHATAQFEFTVNYWPAGISLPESGKLHLDDSCLLFKGTKTELTWNYEDIVIEKASRMGGLVHDAFKVTVSDKEYLLTTVLKDRKMVFDKIYVAIEDAKLHSIDGKEKKKEKPFELPPDEIMSKMNVIAKEKLKGVSMQDYYEVAWSEGYNCDKPPIYAPFLESCGKNDVIVSGWEEGEYTGDWCEQIYSYQRVITFNFMKQTIGQTLVEVKHTQRLLRNKEDRSIVHISMEMKGFPYADCFIVEVRHVASRRGTRDLVIEVGMHIRFLKGCLFEGKIRNNTGNETTKAQLELLRRIVAGCTEYAVKDNEDGVTESEQEESTVKDVSAMSNETVAITNGSNDLLEAEDSALRTLLLVLASLFHKYVHPYVSYKYQEIRPTSVDACLEEVRKQIGVLKDVSLESVKEADRDKVQREISMIEVSLSNIEKMAKES